MVVLVLYYIEKFVTEGLQYIWFMNGTSDHSRNVRIHVMWEKLGANICFVSLNAYILTGCDLTNKMVTKKMQ